MLITMAESSAITTVAAMGWNILPSMPVRLKIGIYTRVIMATPKRLGLITSLVAEYTSSSRCCRLSADWLAFRRLTQFSTMITAPSTIKPKSSAPRLMRLAETPV